MSDGDWRRFIAALRWGGAGAIAVALLVTAWTLGALNASYFQEAEQNAAKYARDTDQHVADACLYRPGFVECAREIIKASQEAQTAQRDLAAQRSMALWALCMFGASIASIVATIVGILYVRRTLELNREAVSKADEANKIAKENGQAQVRAYVVFTDVSVSLEGSCAVIYYTLHNSGNSPAHAVQASAKAIMGVDHEAVWDRRNTSGTVTAMHGSLRQGQSTREDKTQVGTNWLTEEQIAALPNTKFINFQAVLEISYLDVFKLRQTDKFNFVAWMAEPVNGKRVGMSEMHPFFHEGREFGRHDPKA